MINLTSSLREARSERKLGLSALGFQCQSLVHLLLDDRYPQIPSSKFPQSPPLCGHYHCSSPSQKSSIEKISWGLWMVPALNHGSVFIRHTDTPIAQLQCTPGYSDLNWLLFISNKHLCLCKLPLNSAPSSSPRRNANRKRLRTPQKPIRIPGMRIPIEWFSRLCVYIESPQDLDDHYK